MTEKYSKRVQMMLPVRVAVWTDGQRPTFQMACTCDISAEGARLTGLRGVKSVGDVLVLERGKNRGFFRVIWIGKPGTPQHDQVGVQCVEPGKSMWDVNLDEMEEVYEPMVEGLGEQLKPNQEVVEYSSGIVQVQIFSETSGQSLARGDLMRISHQSCQVKTAQRVPLRAAVHILIITEGFDIRMRGFVQPTDVPGSISLGLEGIRRGDRRGFIALMKKAAKAGA